MAKFVSKNFSLETNVLKEISLLHSNAVHILSDINTEVNEFQIPLLFLFAHCDLSYLVFGFQRHSFLKRTFRYSSCTL